MTNQTTDFFTGFAIREKPSATDSRSAERTYKACKALAPRLRRFLGEDFEEVCRAEH